MNRQILARTKWVNLYLESQDAGYVCRKCGVSRPTLRKWVCRYQQEGKESLVGKSTKPHSSRNQKINKQRSDWILDLRRQRNLGARRIQTELIRLHDCSLSLATIHKALTAQHAEPIKKPLRPLQNKASVTQQKLIKG
jgi:transposase-like protein